jgi:CRISPR system Cascade subunit CasC
VADAVGKLDSAKEGRVKTLLFFSPLELQAAVDAMLDEPVAEPVSAMLQPVADDAGEREQKQHKERKEKAEKELAKCAKKAAKGLASSVKDAADIAIFGRMVADDHTLTLEGAGLFSHALSTHQAASEVDFFSAVDDINPEETEGAGHIGSLEFNSACYYRYVGLNWDLLCDPDHLGHCAPDERRAAADKFLRAAVLAVPSARHNSMFGHNPPQFVLGLVRRGQPLSLCNAFEDPIRPRNGYLQPSQAALESHYASLTKTYGLKADQEVRIPDTSLEEFVTALLGAEVLRNG